MPTGAASCRASAVQERAGPNRALEEPVRHDRETKGRSGLQEHEWRAVEARAIGREPQDDRPVVQVQPVGDDAQHPEGPEREQRRERSCRGRGRDHRRRDHGERDEPSSPDPAVGRRRDRAEDADRDQGREPDGGDPARRVSLADAGDVRERREHSADEELAGARRKAVVHEVVVAGRGRDPCREQRDADTAEQHGAEPKTEVARASARSAAPPTRSAATAGRTAPRPRGSSSAAAVTALRTARRTSCRRTGSASSRRTRARRTRRRAALPGSTASDEKSESTRTSPTPASAAGTSRRSRRAQNLGSSSAAFRTPSSSRSRVIRYPERVKNTESDSVAPGKSGDPAWKQKMTAIARPRTPSRPG